MILTRFVTVAAICCSFILSALARTQSTDPAWDAALALKQKSAYAEAVAAFEAWTAANPTSSRLLEGLTETGVCWFSVGRSQLEHLRNTAESGASFKKGMDYFDRVLAAKDPQFAARAQYMRGSTNFFMGDMPGAEAEYSIVIGKHRSDHKYLAKSLEKRAAVRRNQLDKFGALADLQRYAVEFPQGEDLKAVQTYIQHVKLFGTPAPEPDVKAWVQGEPTSIAALKGELVMLYFFASWCENCEQMRPFLLDVFERYESFGVKWIGIVDESVSLQQRTGQTVEAVREYCASKQIRFPVVMTSGGVARECGASGIPALVILDRVGRIRWNDNPSNLMDSTLEALLVEDPAKPLPK